MKTMLRLLLLTIFALVMIVASPAEFPRKLTSGAASALGHQSPTVEVNAGEGPSSSSKGGEQEQQIKVPVVSPDSQTLPQPPPSVSLVKAHPTVILGVNPPQKLGPLSMIFNPSSPTGLYDNPSSDEATRPKRSFCKKCKGGYGGGGGGCGGGRCGGGGGCGYGGCGGGGGGSYSYSQSSAQSSSSSGSYGKR